MHVSVDAHKPGSSRIPGAPDAPEARSPRVAQAVETARAGRPSLAVRTYTATGDPDRILRAHGREASLVVVGSHGHGAIDAVWRGSRSYNLMNWSKAPLCVVPVGWHAQTKSEARA